MAFFYAPYPSLTKPRANAADSYCLPGYGVAARSSGVWALSALRRPRTNSAHR